MNTLLALAVSILTLAACAGCGRLAGRLWRGKSDTPIERLLIDTALGAGVLSLVFFVLGVLQLYRLPILMAVLGAFAATLVASVACSRSRSRRDRLPSQLSTFRFLLSALFLSPCFLHAYPRSRSPRHARLGFAGLSSRRAEAVYAARGDLSYRDNVALEFPDADGDTVSARGRAEPAGGRADAELDVRGIACRSGVGDGEEIFRRPGRDDCGARDRGDADCVVLGDHGVYRPCDRPVHGDRDISVAELPADERAGIFDWGGDRGWVRGVDKDDRPGDNPADLNLAACRPADSRTQIRMEAGPDVRGNRSRGLRAVVCQDVYLHRQPVLPILLWHIRGQGMDGGDGGAGTRNRRRILGWGTT